MSQLPDPSTLDRFVCQGFGDASSFFVEADPTPRQISKYLVGAENWADVLPPDQITVEGILSQRLQLYKCIFCWEWGRKCWGEPCLSWWQGSNRRRTAGSIELRDTGGPMGLGVFATQLIRRGKFLDDYVGELLPDGKWYPGDRYAFDLPGIGRCTSREYGNWTRFVNHRCRPNVRANDWMVGQRVVMMFRAERDIQPGEQLFIEYGRGYFEAANRFCKCDVFPGDHLPPRDTPPEQGRAAAAAGEGGKTVGDDSSLLGNSSPEQATPKRTTAPTLSTPRRANKGPTTPRAPGRRGRQRRAGVNNNSRPGWTRPGSEEAIVDFFVMMQSQLQRERSPAQPSFPTTQISTPRRRPRVPMTPRAPRRRRVGPRGSVSDFLVFAQREGVL